MMIKFLFKKTQKKYNKQNNKQIRTPKIPIGIYTKCSNCKKMIYTKDLKENMYVCSNCGYHFQLSSKNRIKYILDKGTFYEMYKDIKETNFLKIREYEQNSKKYSQISKIDEAVVTGIGDVNGIKVALAVINTYSMISGLRTISGEKITRMIEYATENKLPIMMFTNSSDIKTQESIFSLKEITKISGAISKHDKKGLLYISILTNPTLGKVISSFALQGDIILSEPESLISFVEKQVTEKNKYFNISQHHKKSDHLLERAFIDKIVCRYDMKEKIYTILRIHKLS